MELHASLARVVPHWALWLVVVAGCAAVGFGRGGSWGEVLALFGIVSVLMVGVPAGLHLAFGVKRVAADAHTITIAPTRGAELRLHRRQLVKCSDFAIPKLSIRLLRLVTEAETRWLSVEGFTLEQQIDIRAVLRPPDAPAALSWRRALALRLRGVPVAPLRRALAAARALELPVSPDQLVAHALAGGDVARVVEAARSAREAGEPVDWLRLSAADLAARE